jgi:hypothetical protein
VALFESKEKQLPAVRQAGSPDREKRGLGARAPIRRTETLDVARRLERDFYRDLSSVLRKWEEDLAALEESKRRRVVVIVEEIGLLRLILDSRLVVRKYERSRRGG